MTTNPLNVNVNAAAIETQREQLSTKPAMQRKVEFNEKNYLDVRLKPGETTRKIKIRVLNIEPEAQTPFLVLKTHSLKVDPAISRSGYKSFICLNDPHLTGGETRPCPLCQKAEEYLAKSNSSANAVERKDNFKKHCQYRAKDTFVVRVIDRDHEDEGVKFWRFNAHNDGTGCYDMLYSIYENRKQEAMEAGQGDYNIFDFMNGKDLTITLTLAPNTGKTTISIVDSGFQTPLSKDMNLAAQWINDTKTWRDMYASKSVEYLQIVANGEIPFFDKSTNKWIAKQQKEMDDAAVQAAAQQILNDAKPKPQTASTQDVSYEQDVETPPTDSAPDDLPF